MGLGIMPTVETKILASVNNKTGVIKTTAILVEGYTFNPAGIVAPIAQLSKELDRREGVLQPAADELSQIPGRAEHDREMRAFADTVRKRLAEQAERQARMNGASNDAPAKAHTKPG